MNTPATSKYSNSDEPLQITYTSFSLSPPKGPSNRQCQCDNALMKMKEDGFGEERDQKGIPTDATRILVFLYGRGFRSENKIQRIGEIRQILGDEESRQRMLDILRVDGDKDCTSERQDQYKSFCSLVEQYMEQDGSFGFMKNLDKVKYFLRFQNHGTCYLLAPSMMIAYLLQCLGKDGASPVDVSRFIRHHFTDDELFNYATKDNGGCSAKVLERLLNHFVEDTASIEPNRSLCDKLSTATIRAKTDFFASFAKEGPILLSGCRIHSKFQEASLSSECGVVRNGYWRFDGSYTSSGTFVPACEVGKVESRECQQELHPTDANETFLSELVAEISVKSGVEVIGEDFDEQPSGNKKFDSKEGADELHAMLIIGGRHDKNGKLWLLVQNWWFDMPLVEISVDYLVSTGASCYYVPSLETYQIRVILCDPISTNSADVAECHNLDQKDKIEQHMTFSEDFRERNTSKFCHSTL
jgi:hypothetical protein